MSVRATTSVPTPSASKYLQQLCKHWAHNLLVTHDLRHGEVVFPRDARGAAWPADALVTFDADETALAIAIDASALGQLDGLKGAVIRHLERFAFREAPLTVNWAE